jgi:hypothetical protein
MLLEATFDVVLELRHVAYNRCVAAGSGAMFRLVAEIQRRTAGPEEIVGNCISAFVRLDGVPKVWMVQASMN